MRGVCAHLFVYIVEGKNERQKKIYISAEIHCWRIQLAAHSWSMHVPMCVRMGSMIHPAKLTQAKNENKEKRMANHTRHIHIRRSWTFVRTKSPRHSYDNKISKQDIELWIQNNRRKTMKGIMCLYTIRNSNNIIIHECPVRLFGCNRRRVEQKYSRAASRVYAFCSSKHPTINVDFRFLCGFQRFWMCLDRTSITFRHQYKNGQSFAKIYCFIFQSIYAKRIWNSLEALGGTYRMRVTSQNQ